MPEEKRLIAELVDRNNESIAAQSALTYPKYCISIEEFQQLATATELARGNVTAVRLRLRSLRAAKGRKKDSHDVHKLQNALNELSEEIDTITYASETGKEQLPSLKRTRLTENAIGAWRQFGRNSPTSRLRWNRSMANHPATRNPMLAKRCKNSRVLRLTLLTLRLT
jgi:hypothetical protein